MKKTWKKTILCAVIITVLCISCTAQAADREYNFRNPWESWKLTSWQDYFGSLLQRYVSTPKNVDASFRHNGVYDILPDHLEVSFDPVNTAEWYEISVTRKDGKKKVYTVDYNLLYINAGEDEFISECIAGGSVKIRAINRYGIKSSWTSPVTISHNKIH